MRFHSSEVNRGKRLDLFIHAQMPDHSRARIQDWIKQGRVLVNGLPQKASYALRGAETIDVEPAELRPLKATPEDAPIEILYEDEAVIVINKPAGLVVHAGAGHLSGTLVNRLVHHFQTLSAVGGELRPGIVHRLDRHTSGVLLIARTDAAHQNLAKQFSSRSVEKIYLALVHGPLQQDRGRIDTKIARDPVHRTKMTTRLKTGRTALTEYEVLRRWEKMTFLRVRIGTGRTHQIRVHLSSIGHPVAGDSLYGAPKKIQDMPELGRYFLHASQISFDSPATRERITVLAPLPVELADWMESYNGKKHSP
jgi:23S rRNA pseudouridine1911/1915/1917 synthase